MYKLVTKLVELSAASMEYVLRSLLGVAFIIPLGLLLLLVWVALAVIFTLWIPTALIWQLCKYVWTGQHCHGLDISISKENRNAKDG